MNKAIALILMIILIPCCILLQGDLKASAITEENDEEFITRLINEYDKNTENFDLISVEEIYNKINDEDTFFVYVGRVTCEWCRLFVPILSEYALKHNLKINYLDSTNTETNNDIKNFRELNNIDHVPALLYYNPSLSNSIYSIDFDITDNNFNINKLEEAIVNTLDNPDYSLHLSPTGEYSPILELMHNFHFEFNVYIILLIIVIINCLKTIIKYKGFIKHNKEAFLSVSDIVSSVLCEVAFVNILIMQGIISDISIMASTLWINKVFIIIFLSVVTFCIQIFYTIRLVKLDKEPKNPDIKV